MEESEKLNELCTGATAAGKTKEDDLQEQIDAVAEAVGVVAGALVSAVEDLAAVVPKAAATNLIERVQAIGDISQTLKAEGKE